MKKVSNQFILLAGILQILLGILLIFIKIDLATIILYTGGIAFLIIGMVQIFLSIFKISYIEYIRPNIISGILNLTIGLILVIKLSIILSIINILIGIWIIINGIIEILSSISAKKNGNKYWNVNLIIGILIVALGYILVTADIETINNLANIYIGISLLLNGLRILITSFFTIRKN